MRTPSVGVVVASTSLPRSAGVSATVSSASAHGAPADRLVPVAFQIARTGTGRGRSSADPLGSRCAIARACHSSLRPLRATGTRDAVNAALAGGDSSSRYGASMAVTPGAGCADGFAVPLAAALAASGNATRFSRVLRL